MAVTSQSSAAAIVLLRHPDVDIDARNQTGATALFLASQLGHVGLVCIILQAGRLLSVINDVRGQHGQHNIEIVCLDCP